MEKYYLLLIVALCIVIFVICVMRKKMEMFINFVLRLFGGAVGIYIINSFLVYSNIGCLVGLNGLNILAVGLLGLPGFCMLYTIGVYFMLRA